MLFFADHSRAYFDQPHPRPFYSNILLNFFGSVSSFLDQYDHIIQTFPKPADIMIIIIIIIIMIIVISDKKSS